MGREMLLAHRGEERPLPHLLLGALASVAAQVADHNLFGGHAWMDGKLSNVVLTMQKGDKATLQARLIDLGSVRPHGPIR